MKKLSLLLVMVFVFQLSMINAAGIVDSKKLSISVGAGARMFSEDGFEDVYDSTVITINVDLAYKLFSSVEIFGHTDYLSVDGKTTYTREDTTLKITPLELGFRYLLTTKSAKNQKIYPYLGGGAGYYMIKEDSPIDNLDEKRVGFFVEGGLRVYAAGAIFIDAKVKYVILNSEDDINCGGLALMGGVGISF